MNKDKALRLALEALELVSIEFVCNGAHHAKKDRHEWLDPCPIVDRYKDAITAIKAALEAKDEPVAWYVERQHLGFRDNGLKYGPFWKLNDAIEWCDNSHVLKELYATPPQRKPLTDEEFKHMPELFVVPPHHVEMVVRAIEAAHGIKGEA